MIILMQYICIYKLTLSFPLSILAITYLLILYVCIVFRVFQRDGAKVVIDELSLSFLDGSTVDYHEELIRSAFRIENIPKAEKGCSCGASFAVK